VGGVTPALGEELEDVGGLPGVWAGCQLRAQGVGNRAETAAIFLHEGDSDRSATKRMACQKK